ncbi:EAL domain-containing protein [Vibrio sp. JPW-9-11-11]|uniref:ABC transporter substrate binding protein n=1 Tax=Vibrio sp. JPW-9-11-11 TaxID=1416532 RepID=UPI001592B358|nr:ABC transporter substrate binding protein [Vibrio sp. JPW-9-11-11]NVD06009.1 EAL domain-containing protein [Vibrio sp. JPW-9-11-11]
MKIHVCKAILRHRVPVHSISKLLCVLMVSLVCYAPTFAQADERNVLILNSYHSSFPWTDNLVNTIKNELAKSGYHSLDIEFMDTKEYGFGEEYVQRLRSDYLYKFKDKDLSLVITTDDNALNFVRRFHNEIFNNSPVVFVGVNNVSLAEVLDRHLFTGVFEVEPFVENVELILDINPKVEKILLIFDKTPTGEARWNTVSKTFTQFPAVTFERIYGKETLSELENYVNTLSDDTGIIFGSYYSDASNRYVSLAEGANRISTASSQPVYAMHEQLIDYGVTGGKVINAKKSGQLAASQAIQILKGTSTAKIDMIQQDIGSYIFRHDRLVKYNISPSVLPSSSYIIDQPFNPWREYWLQILVTSLLLTVLLITNIALFKNVKKRESIQRQLEESNLLLDREANIDTLTGLKNRFNFQSWLKTIKYDSSDYIVVYIDIDQFKLINDYYGHKTGDSIVNQVAKRLEKEVPQAQSVYRIGGDEFCLVFSADGKESNEVAASIIHCFYQPYYVEDEASVKVTVSGGMIHTAQLSDPSDSLKYTDIALYQAKSAGGNKILPYVQEYDSDVAQLNNASAQVQKLIREQRDFDFHVQPIVEMKTRHIVGYEMLLRLRYDDGSGIPPPLVVRACELTGAIHTLTVETFKAACRFLAMSDPNTFLTINLSHAQLMVTDVLDELELQFRTSGQDVHRLIIEITEDKFLEESTFIDTLNEFKARDIRLALDDFGSGYSSLSCLKSIPLYISKLDKCFVTHHAYSKKSLTHLCHLCSSLGLRVLAEGIEDLSDYELCLKSGVELGQGYYFSRPIPFEQAIELSLAASSSAN